jgi:hypothetical protein
MQRLIKCLSGRLFAYFCAFTRVAVIRIVEELAGGTICIIPRGGDGTTKGKYSEPSSHGCSSCCIHWTRFSGGLRRIGTVIDAPGALARGVDGMSLRGSVQSSVVTGWQRELVLSFFIK